MLPYVCIGTTVVVWNIVNREWKLKTCSMFGPVQWVKLTDCMTEVSCYMEIYISLHERIKITSFCCFCLVSSLSLLFIFLCICISLFFIQISYWKNRFIVSFCLPAQPMNDMAFYKTTQNAFCSMKSRANMIITYMFNRAHVLECWQ